LLELIRDVIVTKVALPGHALVDRLPTEQESLQNLGSRTTIEELQTLFELLATAEMRVRDSSQPIWMLEVSLLKLASLPPLQSLNNLMVRLESLERRLGSISGEAISGEPVTVYGVREGGTPNDAPPAANTPEASASQPSAAMHSAIEQPASAAELVRRIIESASTRALGWILEQHCKIQLTDTTLEVIFQGNHRMAHELLHEDETIHTLQQIAQTALGRDIPVRIIDAPAPNGEMARAATSGPAAGESLMSLTREAIVRDTVELFGGRILDVRQRSVSRDARDRPMSEDEMASQEDVDDDE
jgi:DNA polymerase III gamma/tau subunit